MKMIDEATVTAAMRRILELVVHPERASKGWWT